MMNSLLYCRHNSESDSYLHPHAVNRAGQMKKGDKRSTFFYFDESGEKLE